MPLPQNWRELVVVHTLTKQIFHTECVNPETQTGFHSLFRPMNYRAPCLCAMCGVIVPVPLTEGGMRALVNAPRTSHRLIAEYYDMRIHRCTRCGNNTVGRCPCRAANDEPSYPFDHDCILISGG